MREPRILSLWPIALSQTCLFVFIQKFLYGYGVPVHNETLYLGQTAFTYFTVLQLVAIAICCAMGARPIAQRLRGISSRAVCVFSIAVIPAEALVLFAPSDFLGVTHGPLLALATLLTCICFAAVGIAWLNRIQQAARALDSATVLLACGAGAFLYCLLTPADGNTSPYTLALELIALPLSGTLALVPLPSQPSVKQETPPSPTSKGNHSQAFLATVLGLLFAIVLAITYMDYLNDNYPAIHLEQATFYACLLVAIALTVAGFYAAERSSTQQKSADLGIAFGYMAAFLFVVLYFIVAFFTMASPEFCFQFSCTARRFVIAFFYLALIKAVLDNAVPPGIMFGPMFVTPILATRALMGGVWLQTVASSFELSSDTRIAVLSILGLALMGLTLELSWILLRSILTAATGQGQASSSATEGTRLRKQVLDDFCLQRGLSEREAEIFSLLSQGYSNARIAEQLFIAPNTVGTHIRSIYKKLGIHSKQEAIDLAAQLD